MPFYTYQTTPEKGKYDYDYIDHAMSFLKENGITAKGHPLWFGHSEVNPQWLKELPYSELREQAREIALHHVSSYAGKVKVWDAMNEAHDWANCFELSQEELLQKWNLLTASEKTAIFSVMNEFTKRKFP